jgi:hypothetical protein
MMTRKRFVISFVMMMCMPFVMMNDLVWYHEGWLRRAWTPWNLSCSEISCSDVPIENHQYSVIWNSIAMPILMLHEWSWHTFWHRNGYVKHDVTGMNESCKLWQEWQCHTWCSLLCSKNYLIMVMSSMH